MSPLAIGGSILGAAVAIVTLGKAIVTIASAFARIATSVERLDKTLEVFAERVTDRLDDHASRITRLETRADLEDVA